MSGGSDRGATEHLTLLLAKVQHLMELRVDSALIDYGLTQRQFGVLAGIARTPGISVVELARDLSVSRQAVNLVVGRLSSAGLVAKAPSGPRYALALTIAGEEILQQAVPRVVEAETRTSDGLEPIEVDLAQSALRRLLGVLSHDVAGSQVGAAD